MDSAGLSFGNFDLWGARVAQCLDVLGAALDKLGARQPDEQEDLTNRALFECLGEATHARMQRPGCLVPAIGYEARNTPSPNDSARASREFKRPDFVWAWHDDLDPDPARSRREFIVECKRLAPSTKNWDFLKRYVTDGVLRFVSVTHGYGMGMPSGVMVGYLQTIDADEALAAVNNAAGANGVPFLRVVRLAHAGGELDHELHRPFPRSPFLLQHIWHRTD